MSVLPGIFAFFFNEFLGYFGVPTGFGRWVLGVVLTTGVVVLLDFLGIKLTVRGTEIFMLVESLILLALAITILAVGGHAHALSFQPFNPGAAIGGSTAIFGALIFGIQANVGYDAVATMAEETRTPKRFIPLATIAAVIVVGIYWIIVSWGFSISVPASSVVHLQNEGFTPITPIARLYWVGWNILITISARTSITGISIARRPPTIRPPYPIAPQAPLP